MPQDHPDTVSLFRWVLQRLEVFGPEAVRWWCLYLAHGRVGMASHELADLLDRKLGADAAATALRIERGLRRYLQRRGPQLDFFHRQLRQAVFEQYIPQAQAQLSLLSTTADAVHEQIHESLADYFETLWSLPLARHALHELPYQRTKAKNWTGVERVLCDLQFIETKCAFGMGLDLLGDYELARQSSLSSSIQLRHLTAFHDAFRSEFHVISNHPEYVFQQFTDHLQWSRDQDSLINDVMGKAELVQRVKRHRWVQNEFRRSAAEMTLVGDEARVTSCAYLSEEQILASGSSDGKLRLWSLAYGTCKAVLDTGGPIRKLLACSDRTIIVLNENGRILICPSNAQSGHLSGNTPEDIAASISHRPDGAVLIAYKSGRLAIVGHAGAGLREEQFNGLLGQTAAVSPTPGTLLIAVGKSIVTLDQGIERVTFDADEHIRTMQVSPDGQWLAAETVNGVLCFTLADLWTKRVLKPTVVIARYGFGVGSSEMTWIANERILWIRRQPHVHSVRTGLCEATLRQFGHWKAQCGCQVDRETVAIGLQDGRIELWRLPQCGPTRIHKAGNSPVISCFLRTASREIISVLKDGRVILQEEEGRREIALIPTTQGSPVCAVSERMSHSLVVGTDQGHVLAVSAESPWPVTRLYSHRSVVLAIRFSPDSRLLASSSSDRSIIVYQREGGAVQSVLARHRRRVTGFAWHTNSRQLFSTSTDRTLRAWDAVKGCELVTCKSRSMLLASLTIDPLGHELSGCDYDGWIRRFTVQGFWDFLNWRNRGWREWRASWGNSEDAFAKAARLPIACPPLPRSSPWNGNWQCEYIAAGVLAYACNSEPLVLLDMSEEDVVVTFNDKGLLDSGEVFTPQFFVDTRSGIILRGTNAGRVFVWELPDEFAERTAHHFEDLSFRGRQQIGRMMMLARSPLTGPTVLSPFWRPILGSQREHSR